MRQRHPPEQSLTNRYYPTTWISNDHISDSRYSTSVSRLCKCFRLCRHDACSTRDNPTIRPYTAPSSHLTSRKMRRIGKSKGPERCSIVQAVVAFASQTLLDSYTVFAAFTTASTGFLRTAKRVIEYPGLRCVRSTKGLHTCILLSLSSPDTYRGGVSALPPRRRSSKAPAAHASPHCTLPSPRPSRAQPPSPQMDDHRMIAASPALLFAACWCRLSPQVNSGGAPHSQQ